MKDMPKATIAILTGGMSSEREVALESAHRIREILAPHYEVRLFDFPRDVNLFLEERKEIQAAIPLFHGRGGEDGTVQGFLQTLNIPFLFSGVAAQALALHKAFTKDVVVRAGITTPAYRVLFQDKYFQDEYKDPCVIKPLDGGSSIGVTIAKNAEEYEKGGAAGVDPRPFRSCRSVYSRR
jgi:D-alanine-D-alanine ligase